jgi:RNA polymerase sigma-70 factor (ECF subfamily)
MPEMSLELERAEDAAIVSLALAKLQPRHREALIATMYEEKRAEVVAAQMGLSDNAFRQLLFRARSAFKKSLIGEAETAGLSMAEILSIAARKARAESGKYVSAAGAFLLVLAISIGVLPNLSGSLAENQVALPEPSVSTAESNQSLGESALPGTLERDSSATALENLDADSQADQIQGQTQIELASNDIVTALPTAIPEPRALLASVDAGSDSERVVLEGFFKEALNERAITTLSRNSVGNVLSSSETTQGTLTITNNSGITANIAYDLATESGIQYTWFTIDLDGNEFVAVPNLDLAEKITNADGTIKLRYLATDLLIGDVSGNYAFIALDDTAVSLGALRLEVNIDPTGKVLTSSLSLTKKS